MARAPDVSVVIATYNRSAVLRQVLGVLRQQTLRNWEAIIVGDACTDDTAAVVATFDEPRFRFVNLGKNHGEQSAPNNEGVRLALGPFIAFLNHDDFWRPDHLERSLERLESTEADLVYAWIANLKPDGTVVLLGVSPAGAYSPVVTIPASAWVLRRELCERVGPWRDGWTIRMAPSQDWIWRAHQLGARLLERPCVSAIGFPSGSRPGSYLDTGDGEHARWRERLATDPVWPEALLTSYIQAQAAGGRVPPSDRPLGQLSWVAKNFGASVAARLGLHPLNLLMTVRHRRRGGLMRRLRATRGLPARKER